MICKIINSEGRDIPVKKGGKNVKNNDGDDMYYHQIGGPVRLDIQEMGVRFPKSIQSGCHFLSRMTNLLTDQMYRMFDDINDIRGGYLQGLGSRLKDWRNVIANKGNHPHFEWVQNADSYNLKINNENMNYFDVFNHTKQTAAGPVRYFLEELTTQFLNENYEDIELELAKKFHLVEQFEKDGKTETNSTSIVRIEHFRDPILGKSERILKRLDCGKS